MKAFPINSTDGKNFYKNTGMDLRDYFAAKSLQSTYTFWMRDYYALNLDDGETQKGFMANYNLIAETAYELADAMMEARNATK